VQNPDARPLIVTVTPQTPAPATTVGDVVLGSLGVAGSLVLVALVLGIVLAGVRVGWNRFHPSTDDHLPPVSPFTGGSPAPPSSRGR
jgi:hypothetical protein